MERRHMSVRMISLFLLFTVFTVVVLAQQPADQTVRAPGADSAPKPRLPKYVLGPGDEIVILAVDADEIANKPYRIPTEGDINLPMIGRVHAEGMTLEELEA